MVKFRAEEDDSELTTEVDEDVNDAVEDDAADDEDLTSDDEAPSGDTEEVEPDTDAVAPSESSETDLPDGGDDYKVLYRRFRPRFFSEIRGQDDIVKSLRRAVVSNRVANAYLFTGERGCGKTTTARVFASALNCPNRSDSGEPCGKCDLCSAVHEGYGAIGITEHDAASNSSVDDVRRIINDAQFSRAANKNVYIIDEVHLLSKAANGALLKTLEEPPPNVVFILCTTNPERLEPAIRSRTTPMNFRTFAGDTMSELVRETANKAGVELTDEQVASVVRKGRGSARDALSALERLTLNTDEDSDITDYSMLITEALENGSIPDIAKHVAKGIESGQSVSDIATHLLALWRNLLLALTAEELTSLDEASLVGAKKLAKSLGVKRIISMLRFLGEQYGKMSVGDPRTILETALFQLTLPVSDSDNIRSIHDRLDEIQDSLEDIINSGGVKSAKRAAEPSPASAEGKPELGGTKKESAPKKSPSLPVIKNSDELIDAIFDAAPKHLALVIPDLEVVENETTDDLLVLRCHKPISDDDFEALEDAVAKVDSREIDLIEE